MSTVTALRCALCGRAFTPARSDARTCSKVCRQRKWRRDHSTNRRATHHVEGDGLSPAGIQVAIPTAEDTRQREAVAARVIQQHQAEWVGSERSRSGYLCSCGVDFADPRGRIDTFSAHRAHQAEKIVEALPWL